MLKIAWSPVYAHPLPEGHRFPMEKYQLIPQQLLHEGTISENNLFEPSPAEETVITLTHTADYWHRLKTLALTDKEIRRIGFPLSSELVHREVVIAGGTIQNACYALDNGISLNVAGGTHHAGSDFGEGFCLLNDMAIAANYLLHTGKAKKILIIDLDVHQGNGTAEIFEQESRVFTFSMHGEKNFPFIKEKSKLDVPLPDGTGDEAYMDLLNQHLPSIIQTFGPDFIFYQSGVDILSTDKLGKLGMSREGCAQRDRYVFETCIHQGLPVAVSMGGGYSEKLSDILEAHCNTFRLAERLFF